MKKILGVLFVFLLAFQLNAQEEESTNDLLIMRPAIGLYGGLNMNMHTMDIPFHYNIDMLNGTFETYNGAFNTNTTNFGFNVGLIGYIPFSNYFVFSPRVGYNTMNGLFKQDFNFKTSTNAEYKTQNQFDAKLEYLELSPIFQIHNLLPLRPLYFLVGAEFGIPMVNQYSYSNDFQNPGTIATIDNDVEITPEVQTRIALALGLGYIFELSDIVKLGLEASYRLPFTDVTTFNDKLVFPNGASWAASQIRLGLNLTFDLGGGAAPVPVEIIPEKKESTLEMQMGSINAVNRDGQRNSMTSIRVEDLQYTELFPFLPYVFFEENSTEVSGDYQQLSTSNEAGAFAISNLQADAEKINSNTLNIVGARMNENPNSTITITGCYDNRKEKNKTLSANRAQLAKDYLVNNYNISDGRIKVVSSGLPSKPSSASSPEGISENRRLEISSNDNKILEPIYITGDNLRVASPDVIEFTPIINSTDPISSFKLDLFQGGRNLRTIRGDYQPTTIQWAISPNDLASEDMPVEYSLQVRSNDANLEKEVKGTIPVEYISITKKKEEELADKTVSRFSLTLFDFDKAEISARDMEIIEKYIIPAIKYNSTVDVYGYTDRIGDENHNLKLSQRRAEAVKKVLESKVSDAKYIIHGVGESVSIYDNDTPVGRQLSRTVQVYITTPK